MFKSLLGAVSMDSLILDIFIILAVVVAGALVVYFLWELISSLINKSKKAGDAEAPKLGEKKEEKKKDDVLVIDYNLDKQEEVAEEEPVKEESLIDENAITEVDEQKAEEEKAEAQSEVSEQERANAERRAYLEARRQELIRRMQAEMEDKEEEPKEEEETSETVEETQPVAEETEEAAETEVAQTEEVEAVETVEQTDSLEEERKALAEEKERYAAMARELEEAKKALAAQNQEAVPVYVPTNGVLSLDELKSRLAEAEERLKETDKEFRQCKKEFNPLHRVWTTHERDERKLRRKEALVAKQKVVLYGVNNYADIDEEKAKKLAEDLDLLDGLKLSVQHCEEVMKKNAERYPLLEKMHAVLSQRNDELRADIAYYKAEIAKLEQTESPSEEN